MTSERPGGQSGPDAASEDAGAKPPAGAAAGRALPAPVSFAGRFLQQLWSANALTVTTLAILLALLVGAILMIIADPAVRGSYGYFFARPGDALGASWDKVSAAYGALLRGAVLNPPAVQAALDGTGGWALALRPLSETLTSATPLVFTGLAFALAFRGGLFNIGVQGQAILGAVGAGLAGFLLPLPFLLHMVVAVVAGGLFGAAWGFIPGFLKARTGAHEVIVTIMLNWVAIFLLSWLVVQRGLQDPDRTDAISRRVEGSARLLRLPEWTGLSSLRVHLGIVLAVLAVAGVAVLLRRATFGFELRAVGLSPDAARAAGMSVTGTFVLVMAVAGSLAGLGGASLVLGTAGALTPAVIGSVGFDGILVGLLGRAKPWGVLAAAILFGGLQAGGRQMQVSAGISLELVQVIQALVVILVAAPVLVKTIFALRAARIRSVAGADVDTGRGW